MSRNTSVSFQTARDSSKNASQSFKTAKDTSGSSNADKTKDSCICSPSFKTAIGSPMGNITVPPLDKSKLPFGVLMRKLQRQMVRRDAPKGEDLEGILKVLGTVEGQDITVQEFMGLVSPYTGDNGAVLRTVFNDDITSFKKMCKKVFETLTQDNSDVLLNQQLTIGEYYCEKTQLLQRKLMAALEDIYLMAPCFDFDRYDKEKEKYLEDLFPVPAEMADEPDELQMTKRQMAFQHLHWLRQEADRLNAENEEMKERLNQVKLAAQDDNCRALDLEEDEEDRRLRLEEEEQMKRLELEELNNLLESAIIQKERKLRKKGDESVHDPGAALAADQQAAGTRRKRREWKEGAAKMIDFDAIAAHSADTNKSSSRSS